MKTILTLTTYFVTWAVVGQTLTNHNPRVAPITYEVINNDVFYEVTTPTLNQKAGAPKAFYTFFWEFGDGEFSFKKSPKHRYKKSGNYPVSLWATNNYDNGKPPATRPTIVTIENDDSQASAIDEERFPENEDLLLNYNRQPLPEEELVFITSYKNPHPYVSSGKLYFFFNGTQFKKDTFILEATRTHHNEHIVPLEAAVVEILPQNDIYTQVASIQDFNEFSEVVSIQDTLKRINLPATLENAKNQYRNCQVIAFNNMQPGEKRNIFRTLRTTPEMIKDTSAMVTLRSVYVPDEKFDNHTVKDTEMEIVTSHDPNKMSSNGWLMNYRLVRFKRLRFKVRFQNIGAGPASNIRLEAEVPEMFDKSTFKIEDLYPKCPICPKAQQVNYSCLDTIIQKDKIVFNFKRVYLPGKKQRYVAKTDSTKGFVKYSMKFRKGFTKQNTKSRTQIYFDNQEPITTNYAQTHFIPGISIGAKAGYSIAPELDNHKEFFIGATLSPYKPCRLYYQAEILFSWASFDQFRSFQTSIANTSGIITNLTLFSESNQLNTISTYLVPASLRYNFNNYIAIGTGVQFRLDLSENIDQQTTGEVTLIARDGAQRRASNLDTFTTNTSNDSFKNFQTGLFLDLNIGTVRLGPSIGARYSYNFNAPNTQIQFYGIWKF